MELTCFKLYSKIDYLKISVILSSSVVHNILYTYNSFYSNNYINIYSFLNLNCIYVCLTVFLFINEDSFFCFISKPQ